MSGGGSKKGQRRGGRSKGTPNVKTLAAEVDKQRVKETAAKVAIETGANPKLAAAAVYAALTIPVRKGLKEKFEEEILPRVWDMVAYFQNRCLGKDPDGTVVVLENSPFYAEFQIWLDRYTKIGGQLLPYNYPTLKAIEVTGSLSTTPMPPAGEDGKITRIGDPIRAAREYARFMQAPRPVLVIDQTTKKRA